jgi:NAD(P)H dehydrogenase (quinone)
MSKYLFVTAHPEPGSFNHALTSEALACLRLQGHQVEHSDLCAMQWQPVADRRDFTTVFDASYYKQQREELYASEHDGFAPEIKAEIEKLFWCDVMVLQFPLWWFGMPAILKGWVDRVFVMGKIYGQGKWYETGSFRGKKAMVSVTTGSGKHLFGEGGLHPPMETLLLPIHHGIFRFNGFEVLEPFVAWQVAHLTDEERKQLLHQYREKIAAIG